MLVAALQRAHLLVAGLAKTAPSNIYDRRLVRLAFLAPGLQQDNLTGKQPAGLTVAAFRRAELPLRWSEQRAQGW